MLKPYKILLITSKYDIHVIEQSPIYYKDYDLILCSLPGLGKTLNKILPNLLTLEGALDRFNISQFDITTSSTNYICWLRNLNLYPDSTYRDISFSLRPALENYVALYLHNFFAFKAILDAVTADISPHFYLFNKPIDFKAIDRLDLTFLLRTRLTFSSYIAFICSKRGIPLTILHKNTSPDILINRIRTFTISCAKLLIAFKRQINFTLTPKIKINSNKYDAIFILRSNTEILQAKPILVYRKHQGKSDLVLYDDLYARPDCTANISKIPVQKYNLYQFSNVVTLFISFSKSTIYKYITLPFLLNKQYKNVNSDSNYFLQIKQTVAEVFKTLADSIPELYLHDFQISNALALFTPNSIVSFDTIDRWGALQSLKANKYSTLR